MTSARATEEKIAAFMIWLLIAIFYVNLLSGYLNSWLLFVPIPSIGSVFRDFLFACFVAALVVYSLFSLLDRKVFVFPAKIWVVAAFFGILLIPFAPDPFAAILGYRNIFYPLIGVAILTVLARSRNSFQFSLRVRAAVVWLFLIVAFVGVVDFFTNGEFTLILGFNPEYNEQVAMMVRKHLGITRANAGVSDALNYGYLMAFAFVYFFYLQRVQSIKTYRWVILVGSILAFLACMLSMTRGAILAVLLAWICYSMYRYPLRGLALVTAMAIFGAVFIVEIEYGQIMLDRFTESDTGSEKSSDERVSAVEGAINALGDSPLIGMGLGTQGAATAYQDADRRIATDNSFFWILLETGISGFMLIMAAYLAMFVYLLKRIPSKEFKAFLIISHLILLISALLSSAPVSPTFSIALWAVLVIESFLALGNKPMIGKQS